MKTFLISVLILFASCRLPIEPLPEATVTRLEVDTLLYFSTWESSTLDFQSNQFTLSFDASSEFNDWSTPIIVSIVTDSVTQHWTSVGLLPWESLQLQTTFTNPKRPFFIRILVWGRARVKNVIVGYR